MVAVFSVAAGMIGVCLTGIGLLHVANAMHQITTLADELLAVNSLLFLGSCMTAFISFRVKQVAGRHSYEETCPDYSQRNCYIPYSNDSRTEDDY